MTHQAPIFNVADLSVVQAADHSRGATPPPQTDITVQAAAVQIVDQASYDRAVEILRATKDLQTEAERVNRPLIASAHETHKKACDRLNQEKAPLDQAERIVKAKIGQWDDAQKRIAAEIARKQAEAEAQRQAEELEKEIEAVEAAGAPIAEVREIIRQAERAPVIVPAAVQTYTKAKGIFTTPTLTPVVTNLQMLIRHVAEHPEHSNLLQVNQTALNAVARAYKSNLKIPGVTLQQDSRISSRR